VSRTGDPLDATTSVLRCHPAAGTLSGPQAACDQLDSVTRWGQDPFAPVPNGVVCTRQYGGPAIAYVRGTWAGRPVATRFSRVDGCEIARWRRLSMLLGTPWNDGTGPIFP
jgi:hypothetical protein